MASTLGREQRVPQFDTTRAHLARRWRNLLLPILLLAGISLLAVGGVLYWSAGSLNERQAQSQEALVKSVMQLRRDMLRQLVIDYAWWDEAVVSHGVTLDERWAREGLGEYLRSNFQIAAGWVVSPRGETLLSFERGQGMVSGPLGHLPVGAEDLVATARAARSIEEVPAARFVIHEQELALVAASVLSPLSDISVPENYERNVLVFLRPVDLKGLERAGIGGHLEDLHFVRGPAPPGWLDCPVKGVGSQILGHIVWRDHRPGSQLLWNAAPFLLVPLLAIGVLLVLTIRRVGTVISEEGKLSISLYQEKQRRTQKSRFVSMVSHELRTPLQAISTSADMLERFGDQMNARERREEARTIRTAVATLAGLVDDVLVMGRSEKAEESTAAPPIDLGRFCQAMWREVSVALRSKQEMQLDDRIGEPIHGVSELALHTIVSNLLQNAVKYSRGQGPVKVRLERTDGECRVTVTDFGPGVDVSQREAIFQPYWRAQEVEAISGTGLGLAVARSAARSLGGDLVLKCAGGSSAPDCGTCFMASWPVTRA